jgi:transcriptional repressor NrdR
MRTAERHGHLFCPECRTETPSIILDSRQSRDGRKIRRRRECLNKHRFTTYETEEREPAIDFQI